MTTQYTPILKLALPTTGELNGTWGDVVNNNITSMVEQAVAGLATISTWTSNSHTLTVASGLTSESRCAVLVATSTVAASQIICPAASKLYVLRNNSSFAVTLKTSGGTGTAVPAGDTVFLFCDGTNVLPCNTTVVSTTGTANGVLYLNASKVMTSSSGMTFDGTTFTLTGGGVMSNVTLSSASGTTAGKIGYTGGAVSFGDGSVQRTVATLDGIQTLTNKTLSGASNTLTNIANASLTNSSFTLGSTSISLGATATTIAGLTSVTSTTFVGALTGNASTVTNGVYTTGTQTLGGTYTFSNTIVGSINGNAATVTNGVYTTGTQTLGGTYTFSNTIVGSINGNAATATNQSGGTVSATTGAFSGVLTANAAFREKQIAVAASNIDLATGNFFSRTISGATTFTVSNTPTTGTAATFVLDLTNGGSATVTWWTGVKWASGSAPLLTASGRDVLGFFTYDGGTTWTGLLLARDVK